MEPTLRPRLDAQMAFLLEADKLKQIDRANSIGDGSRRENSAEHSWHVSLMAMVLAEHAPEPISLGRVLELLALHDLVEVYAGDTVIYDDAALIDQAERERLAADRLFALLPADQADCFHAGWREFEECSTPEARFAKAVDALAPSWLHWGDHAHPEPCGYTESEVRARKAIPLTPCPVLWDYFKDFVRAAAERGLFVPSPIREAERGTGQSPV